MNYVIQMSTTKGMARLSKGQTVSHQRHIKGQVGHSPFLIVAAAPSGETLVDYFINNSCVASAAKMRHIPIAHCRLNLPKGLTVNSKFGWQTVGRNKCFCSSLKKASGESCKCTVMATSRPHLLARAMRIHSRGLCVGNDREQHT